MVAADVCGAYYPVQLQIYSRENDLTMPQTPAW